MLARKGWRVLLLEREHFPRDHVGESLLPASIPVLEELGVLSAISQAGFLPKWGATMVWGKDRTPWSWYFRETNLKYPHSYQVWRPQFDHLLLQNCRENGVDVREGHRVIEVLFQDGRATGVRYVVEGEGEGAARARFVVDATGQAGLLTNMLGTRRWDPLFQNMAVYGYFAGFQPLPPPDSTNIFVESYEHGWIWNIPLHTGRASVGAVVDTHTGQGGIREHGVRAYFIEQIGSAPHTARMLREATLVAGPFVARDWSYTSDRLVGDGFILVGDAACFVDPLFSSGVHLALMSGVLAAAYVTSALKDPSMREAAGRVYEELYKVEYGHFRTLASLFYSSNRAVDSYFWDARRLLEDSDHLSPRHAFINAVAGQSPRGYERAVLERGIPPPEFVHNVRILELEREERRTWYDAARSQADLQRNPLYRAVPSLESGVRVHTSPVIADGEFLWGHVLTTASRQQGTPCSTLVAELVALIDGDATVADLLARLRPTVDEGRWEQMESSAVAALGILYVEGAIAEFRGL